MHANKCQVLIQEKQTGAANSSAIIVSFGKFACTESMGSLLGP